MKAFLYWLVRAPVIIALVLMVQLSGIGVYVLLMQNKVLEPYQAIDVVPTFQN